ncbi:MAG: chemotaxis response regulator protein-glutamate methylesterase [Gammaproteobacteria bacterium]|nr:chemotaxis response regulator protein-glutamate methylesterase [Gammaproteobacteria bacterium]MBQ0840511.1 chemotaxis response regulator protein-glutamate methylesterase [Gammaproteobacteria bacterium]
MIRVFIVDDSATVRKVVSEILNSAPDIKVIGSAQNPVFADKRMADDWPDVIVLDIEMPQMDGLTYLKKLMVEHPTPVVMCSTLTQSGSATSIKALGLGAVEVVGKPTVNLAAGLNDSARELIEAVRGASVANIKRVVIGVSSAVNFKTRKPVSKPPQLQSTVAGPGAARGQNTGQAGKSLASKSSKLIVIGTSTGGTQALELVLSQLPDTTPGIAVVQHMPEGFTKAFAERLNSICTVEVKEAEQGDLLRPGLVLIAPGGRHLQIQRRGFQFYARIVDGPTVSRHRPSVDVLFRSVAKFSSDKVLAVIMTGMGEDGASGMKELHDNKAKTVAQNEATCVVFGMPAMAIKAGAVDDVVPLEGIAQYMIEFT